MQAIRRRDRAIKAGIDKAGATKKRDAVNNRLGKLDQKYGAIRKNFTVSFTYEGKGKSEKATAMTWTRNDVKTAEKQKFHGKYVLLTSLDENHEVNIWKFYNVIRTVEETFRVLKSDLDIRTVYHKSDDGIKAHLNLAVLAYWLVSVTKYRIKARDSKDEIIIIEVQITRELYYLERVLYAVAKAITEHIELEHIYSEVKKVYSISILYFDIGKGDDYLYHEQNAFRGVHTGDFLQVTSKEKDALVRRLPSEIFPKYFLIRVNEFDKVAMIPLEEWMDYLKSGHIRPDTKAPRLEEARQKLIYYNMDTAEREAYDRHIDAIMIQNDVLSTAKLEGLAEGRGEGLAEGETRERIKLAGQALKMGMSIEDVARLTGLSREEIKNTFT